VLLAPAPGPKFALLLLPTGYLLLAGRSAWQRPRTWLPAAALAAGGMLAPPLAFVSLP
jgi:spermidine synthase